MTPDMPVVVALHHHPFPLGAPVMESAGALSDGEALHILLKNSTAHICVGCFLVTFMRQLYMFAMV